MKRKKRRLTFGKVQGPDFQPQDIRCPFCHGTGEEANPLGVERRNSSCIACLSTGKREVFAARLLSGEIQLDEMGRPFEPDTTEAFRPRDYKGKWKFENPALDVEI